MDEYSRVGSGFFKVKMKNLKVFTAKARETVQTYQWQDFIHENSWV